MFWFSVATQQAQWQTAITVLSHDVSVSVLQSEVSAKLGPTCRVGASAEEEFSLMKTEGEVNQRDVGRPEGGPLTLYPEFSDGASE